MNDNFVKTLGYLGVTARLKRLSDNISYSIKALYKEQHCDLEPSWHLVFLYLIEREQCSMSELAAALQVSTPAILKVCNKMEQKGYVQLLKNPEDSRKRDVTLSAKAKQAFPELLEIWQAGQKAIEEVLASNPEFLPALEKVEDAFNQKSFKARAQQHLQQRSGQ